MIELYLNGYIVSANFLGSGIGFRIFRTIEKKWFFEEVTPSPLSQLHQGKYGDKGT